jgi:hypothetical protein
MGSSASVSAGRDIPSTKQQLPESTLFETRSDSFGERYHEKEIEIALRSCEARCHEKEMERASRSCEIHHTQAIYSKIILLLTVDIPIPPIHSFDCR